MGATLLAQASDRSTPIHTTNKRYGASCRDGRSGVAPMERSYKIRCWRQLHGV